MRALALAVALVALVPATASAAAPWRDADGVRDALFDAQSELILGSEATATRAVARARKAYAGDLRQGIRAADGDADAAVMAALRDAGLAARRGDAVRLAAARGAARAAVFRGSYAATLDAVDARRRADGRPVAAAARVPHRDALHPPGRRRDDRGAPARARAARARARARGGDQGPARRLPGPRCASCSTTRAAAPSASCPSGVPRPPPRRRATSRSSPPATRRTAGRRRPRRRAPRSPRCRRGRPTRRPRRRRSRASPRPRSRRRRRPAAPSSSCASSRSCRSSTAAASTTHG